MCIQSLFKNGLIVGIFGAVFTVTIAILGWVAMPNIIANVSKKTLVLEENNFVWNIWYDPPYPIYTDFYIFNCTNYNDVVRNGTKPIVVELGPYSYREYRKKNTSVLENSDEIVYYREHRWYYFSQATSGPGLSLSDVITTVNPVYMTVSKFLDILPVNNPAVDIVVDLIDNFLKERNESVFMTVTADELIFKGWPMDTYIELYERIQDIFNPWPPFFPPLPPGLPTLPEIPPSVRDDITLGLFKAKNDSDDGIFRVNRGTFDYRAFADIEAWGRNQEKLSPYLTFWPGEKSYCNEIQGTDGTVFPYGIDVDDKIWIYQTDLCRSIYVVYEQHETYADLPGRRFNLPKSVLENRTNAPENECFCLDEEDEGVCPNTGALFIGACYGGAPLIGSNPHFYNGDPRYVNGVEGLNPNQSKHETYLILEERTNTLLYASKRVQLSIDVRKTRLSDTLNLTTRVFLPMLWYEENAQIDEGTAKEFNVFIILTAVMWTLFAIGLILTVVGVFLIGLHFHKEKKLQKVY
ncbi:hypothetical protein DAPPUDRAFT_326408 [Daphnia pulex]|uniref:Uncharacterized protein n=1 Tax=Daphnia pulex TaxID=6669 RepID=E9H7N2_DAPPU|nr:hypothetical protein DAPPUDRAFT_326408 [Daphnia pulex]|eukprot:EFX72214.1 hypothetical protein DAPPUDRAFT_326408 [Daphnia pulex]